MALHTKTKRTTRRAPVGKAKASAGMSEIGVTGLKRWGGEVTEEFLKELQGAKGIKIFREMKDNDAIIGAILYTILHLARGTSWTIEPASESREDRERAEFVSGAIFDDMSTSWEDTLSEILSMLWAGWAYLEVVFKRRLGDARTQKVGPGRMGDPSSRRIPASSKFTDGKIGFRKWAIRAQETLDEWEFDDEDGGLRGMWQSVPETGKRLFIPIERALLFRTQTERGNPMGKSLLRNAYRPWYYKKKIQVFEAIGIERDLAGYPVLQVKEPTKDFTPPDPWSTTDAKASALKDNLEKIAVSIRRDELEGLVLPHWLSFSLVSTGGKRQFDTSAIITRYDQRIAMTMAADFILIGHDAVGSKALANSKISMFTHAVDGLLDNVTSTVNRFGIPSLLRVNGMPTESLPKFVHGSVENVDMAELSESIAKLSGAGMEIFPAPEFERKVLEMMRLPTSHVVDLTPAELKALRETKTEPAEPEPEEIDPSPDDEE